VWGFLRRSRPRCGAAWKAGKPLHVIGRAFGKPHTSIHCLLSHHYGIFRAARRRALLTLTLTEREEVSRGIAYGSSIREVAKDLERAASTVRREVARRGSRDLTVHLVLDNYATHKTKEIRTWFLRHPRCHLHFTPKHSSWLKQVERWGAFTVPTPDGLGHFP
jgi:DDE superfamily endonuclease/Helix-turn-helix domain